MNHTDAIAQGKDPISDAGNGTGISSHCNRVHFFRVLVALLFVVAGALHFFRPQFYMKIMPPYLPAPLALVYLSGAFEILGGAGILIPQLRSLAGYGLIALLIAVFPANIEMLCQCVRKNGWSLFSWLLLFRLPLQLVIILIVHRLTKKGRA